MDYSISILFFLTPIVVALMVKWLGKGPKVINVLLSFSGAFLLAIAVLHIFPELYFTRGAGIGFWILAGFLIQVVLEFLSKGIEHGHLPGSGRLPAMVLLSLCCHSFIEGMPFAGFEGLAEAAGQHVHDHGHGAGNHHDGSALFGLPLVLGVLLHKIPVSVALASVLVDNGTSNRTFGLYVTLFAASFPLGMLLGPYIQGGPVTLLAVSMGMLLHISMTIIFESSKNHRIVPIRFIALLVGIAAALAVVL